MTPPNEDLTGDRILDRAAHAVRVSKPSPAEAEAAAARVHAALKSEADAPFDCAAFRRMTREALAGGLPPQRRLLFDAHTRDCVACRHALRDAREGHARTSKAPAARRPGARRATRWIAAAAALAAVVLGAYVVDRAGFGGGSRLATINVIDGRLFEVSGGSLLPLVKARKISYGAPLRTAPGSNAVVELPDGTRIEMDERTELTLAARGRDTDIRLARGNVIVEAARQKDGHLFVTTGDCEVAVVGTVFAVNAGTRGSRVSVLEGRVHVEKASQETVLLPGGQYTSSAALGPNSFAEEVAWSRNREQYMALIAELATLRAEIAALPGPAARTSTRLLEMMPAQTVAYAGLPNIATNLADSQKVFLDHLRTNAALRDWWAQAAGANGTDRLDEAVQKIQRFGRLLGDEIAVGLVARRGAPPATGDAVGEAEGEVGSVVVLADVRDAAGLRAAIDAELKAAHGDADGLRLVSALPAAPSSREHELVAFIGDDLLIASTDAALVNEAGARRAAGGAFAGTPFGRRMAQVYADGAVWVGGADLGALFRMAEAKGPETEEKATATLQKLGLSDARFLVLESRGDAANAVRKATVEFDGERHGMAAWLSEAAPMGSLEFISPDATFVGAALLKDPAAMLDDLLAAVGDGREGLAQMRAELGVDLREDLLASLGGEAALALDGPVLPIPSIKLVLEVYDAGRLQHALETLVGRANAELAEGQRLALVREEAGGRTWWSLQHASGATYAAYTFEDGYLVLASQRGLIERALANRAAGVSLRSSAKFAALMPRDRDANVSAFGYRGGGESMDALTKALGGLAQGAVPPGGAPSGGSASGPGDLFTSVLAASSGPALVYATGERDRITVGTSGGDTGLLGLTMLLGMAQGHDAGTGAPEAPPAAPPATTPPAAAPPATAPVGTAA